MDKFRHNHINFLADKNTISRIFDPTRPTVIYKNIDPTQSDPWVDPTRGHLWDSCQQLTLSHESVQQ